jgi:hypothetical protein
MPPPSNYYSNPSNGHGGSQAPKLTATKKTAKPKNPVPKTTAAHKAATVKLNRKAREIIKTAAVKTVTNKLVVTPHPPTSPLEDITDLLDNLPFQACVLTRPLFTSTG